MNEYDPVEVDFTALENAVADLARHSGTALKKRSLEVRMLRMQRIINRLVSEMEV